MNSAFITVETPIIGDYSQRMLTVTRTETMAGKCERSLDVGSNDLNAIADKLLEKLINNEKLEKETLLYNLTNIEREAVDILTAADDAVIYRNSDMDLCVRPFKRTFLAHLLAVR